MAQKNSNGNEMVDIFNLSLDNIDLKNQEKGESLLYNPKPDNGKDGIYRSLVRFLPILKHPQTPYVRKFIYWLEDGNGQGTYYDSPSTVGEKCPVQDLFFKLRNSESVADKSASEKLKRKEVFYSLIQIIKDPFAPELEGKIKIFKFGTTIKQKIDQETKPEFEEGCVVWDVFEGKNFELTITKKSGFANYDNCKFQSSKTPLVVDGAKLVKSDEKSKKSLIDYLNSAPDVFQFEYKPWTDEQRAEILSLLKYYSGGGKTISNIVDQSSAFNERVEPRKIQKPAAQSKDADNEEGEEAELKAFLDNMNV